VKRSVVTFVASCLCLFGTWSALLVYELPPEELATSFTWAAGGIVRVLKSSLDWWHDASSETHPGRFESAELLKIRLLGKRMNSAKGG
jgi:hypothetical protein